MRYFFIVLTTVISFKSVSGQTTEDSVKRVINKMFSAMKTSDSSLLKSTFSESVIFQTIAQTKEGKTVVRNESPEEFIEQIGKSAPGSLDERIEFESLKTDGSLAIAWTPYKFYYMGKFSHCGVNSFQLVRINGNWKIQYIIDTRRKTGCGEP